MLLNQKRNGTKTKTNFKIFMQIKIIKKLFCPFKVYIMLIQIIGK